MSSIMRKIGSMKTLSMEMYLEDKRRAARAERNRELCENMRRDCTCERAFARLCALRGLNMPESEQKELNFA